MERLIPIHEASELLGGISRWTLYGWISQGRIQRVKIGGRVMISAVEIRRLQNGDGLAPVGNIPSEPQQFGELEPVVRDSKRTQEVA